MVTNKATGKISAYVNNTCKSGFLYVVLYSSISLVFIVISSVRDQKVWFPYVFERIMTSASLKNNTSLSISNSLIIRNLETLISANNYLIFE